MADWAGIIAIIFTPLVRSAAGWLENALEDGIISEFEWRQLLSTVLRVGLTTAAIYFGIGTIPGVDIHAFSAGAAGFLFDLIYRAVKVKYEE